MKNFINPYLTIFFLIAFLYSCSSAQSPQDEISVSKILRLIEKGEPVFYSNKRVIGDLDFTTIMNGNEESVGEIRNYINSSITFHNCVFEGKLIAFKKEEKYAVFTSFLKNLTFIKCNFTKSVTLRDSDVEGALNFTESVFHEEAVFEGLRAKGRTNSFNSCIFNAESKFQRIEFFNTASFFKVYFSKGVNFQASYFHREAMFRSCKFGDKVNYSSMTVLGGFSLNYSEFEAAFIFQNANIIDRSEFINCTFKSTILLKGSSFFGECRFQKSIFSDKIEITDCLFARGLPEFDETNLSKESIIEISNSFYLNSLQLQIRDLVK